MQDERRIREGSLSGTVSPPAHVTGDQASGRGNAAFRVCTANDFNPSRNDKPGKRKAGQPMTACQNCRVRKVKCAVSDAQHSRLPLRCQPCKQASLECRWDGIDRRRRQHKRRHVDISHGGRNKHRQSSSAQADGGLSLLDPGSSPLGNDGSGPGIDPSPRPEPGNQSQDPIRPAPISGIGSIDETEIDPSQLQGSQLFAEFCPEISNDLPDMQDFVLGLDFMGDAGTFPLHLEGVNAGSESRPLTRHGLARLRYYRRFGPTAVVPGLRRLSVVVYPEPGEVALGSDHPETDKATSAGDFHSSPGSTASNRGRLFDKSNREPHPDMVSLILDVFFGHFGGHFPFLHPQILGGHVRAGEASSFLLNAIAALTVRFCPLTGPLEVLQEFDAPWRRGAPFLKKAKEQVVPLLSIPAPEVVAGLLILAWAEFGDNNEAGLWMFAGMAIRMAQDLGLHRIPDTGSDPNVSFHDHARPSPDGGYILTDEQSTIHQEKARLVMFWSVFIMDVCVSLVTGRPPTIRRSEIEVSVPTAHDMKLAQLDFQETQSMQNMIFPETVRYMLQFSEALETLNQRQPSRSAERHMSLAHDGDENLSDLRHRLVQSYNSLPQELLFSIENYKASSSCAHSGLFLTLHLFFYTFMTLLSNTRSRDARQDLRNIQNQRPSANNIFQEFRQPGSQATGSEHQAHIATLACQKMVQVLTVADLTDNTGYLATPFTNHCFFVAASTILQDAENLETGHKQQDSLFPLVARIDYEFLYRKLQDQGHYFGAINSVTAVLEQSKRFRLNGEVNRAEMNEDDEDGGMLQRVVDLGDTGIVNRYTIPCY